MSASAALRTAVTTAIGAAITGAMLVGAVPSAFADPASPPAPGCSAGDFEQIRAEVAAATSAYFFAHPDVNAFFSSIKGQPKDQTRGQVQTYLDDNPQAKSDLAGIRQPLQDMKNRCQ
jgi:hemophore-related protein